MSRAGRGSESGFSLVALMAAMTIMLILMGAAMPSWKYVAQNEREQELYFRGDQIASAIERYQKKNGGAPPPSLAVLVKGKFLRQAYEDPMAKDGKWKFIKAGEVVVPRMPALPGMGMPGRPVPSPEPRSGTGARGDSVAPFVGVTSTNTDESLRVMNGQDHYDQWLFLAGRPRFLGREGPQIPGGNAAPPPHPSTAPGPGQTK